MKQIAKVSIFFAAELFKALVNTIQNSFVGNEKSYICPERNMKFNIYFSDNPTLA
jgi:hypothetical protein